MQDLLGLKQLTTVFLITVLGWAEDVLQLSHAFCTSCIQHI